MAVPETICTLIANRNTAITLAYGKNEASLAVHIMIRLTFVFRCPHGIHACETRCRALMSRGIRSRNKMLIRLRRGIGYKCKGHGCYHGAAVFRRVWQLSSLKIAHNLHTVLIEVHRQGRSALI
jgi:hypothetical protein